MQFELGVNYMQKIDRAILVALNHQTPYDVTKASIDELEELAKALEIKTVDKVIQTLSSIDPRYYIGSGKVQEIKGMVDVLNADMVIFDDTLSSSQIRNLEEILQVQILDRSFLILQIFALRAQTRQAILEVSLAQKLYLLPRLVGMGKSLSRQGGGSFNAKGPGETKLELDRRKLNDEIIQLTKELEVIKKERVISRQRRVKNNIPIVALVGYTNAGKSSLMNYLASHYGKDKTDVFEKDMLFATLDTKSKRIQKDNHQAFILTDTVGFISKLPPELVKSFESTLSDITSADLILHIVDGKQFSPLQLSLTKQVLEGLGCKDTPRILVVTKKDLGLTAPMIQDEYIHISSKTGEGIDDLYRMIDSMLYKDARIYKLLLPFDAGNLYQLLKSNHTVLETSYESEGIYTRVVLNPKDLHLFEKYILTSKNVN